jgi:hypothetical protein
MVKKPTILKKLAAFFPQSQGSGTTTACNESWLNISAHYLQRFFSTT